MAVISPRMQEPGYREAYPATTVLVSNLLSICIYGTGAYILFGLNIFLAAAYVIFVAALEFRLIRGHCVDCYYFGKTCAFGKGRVSRFLFEKGHAERFSQRPLTWGDMVPDLLVFIIPLLAGVILLIQGFTWVILILIAVLFLLSFPGTAYVRTRLACRYCKQRGIGCPAERLFDSSKKP